MKKLLFLSLILLSCNNIFSSAGSSSASSSFSAASFVSSVQQAIQSSNKPQTAISVEVEYANCDEYKYFATSDKKFWSILTKDPKAKPYYMKQYPGQLGQAKIEWHTADPVLKAAIEQVQKAAEPIMTDGTSSLWAVSNQNVTCVDLKNGQAMSKFNIDYSVCAINR